ETHELVLQVLTKLVLLGTLRYVHRSSFHRLIVLLRTTLSHDETARASGYDFPPPTTPGTSAAGRSRSPATRARAWPRPVPPAAPRTPASSGPHPGPRHPGLALEPAPPAFPPLGRSGRTARPARP